jgi:hypothetical protein
MIICDGDVGVAVTVGVGVFVEVSVAVGVGFDVGCCVIVGVGWASGLAEFRGMDVPNSTKSVELLSVSNLFPNVASDPPALMKVPLNLTMPF